MAGSRVGGLVEQTAALTVETTVGHSADSTVAKMALRSELSMVAMMVVEKALK